MGTNGLHIKGLSVVYDEYESAYYYNKEMLSKGFCIEKNEGESIGHDYALSVAVNYLGEDNAMTFIMYQGEYLEGIQLRHIVKELFELFNEDPDTYLEKLHSLSGAYISASSQSNEEIAEDVRMTVECAFEIIEDYLAEEGIS